VSTEYRCERVSFVNFLGLLRVILPIGLWRGVLNGLLSMHPVGRLLCLAGGGEDRAWIIFEGPEPGGDVGGVLAARAMGNAEIGQDEARRQLTDLS
jgi:hypothetical protein